jgi:hypothetical protein
MTCINKHNQFKGERHLPGPAVPGNSSRRKKMFELTIFIPLADNDGREYSAAHHAQFERAILDRFGGFSSLPGTIAGQWMDDGRLYRDELRVYSVAVASIVQGSLVGELVEIAKAHYRQEAIFLRYLGQVEII